MVQPRWTTVWRSLKELNIELTYDPAVPLLGISLEKTITQEDTCIPVFVAALFINAKPRHGSNLDVLDEWVKKVWYPYTMKY